MILKEIRKNNFFSNFAKNLDTQNLKILLYWWCDQLYFELKKKRIKCVRNPSMGESPLIRALREYRMTNFFGFPCFFFSQQAPAGLLRP